ncbi:hypothetical protein HANVADRAFT_60742 [Hanseniaspora valbyensis NRRL Y-1626]|uniref:RRM domain-containing protein n=1 Tax=Hanseniaspora valbyensis NRRL Y-1626 TaxID=766949 RepID=A0A1B7TIU2_9ASCO|nr:hypothetical protein HANVADRAFT_60742 [Hanseniaspora valbyensis NRRL Y-1626]
MSLDIVKDTIEELKSLKKGVSAKRINKITEFTLKNLPLEDEITDLIVDYSKTASISHKVGSLYLIDSLGRGALSNCNDLGMNILEDDNQVGTLQHIIKKFSTNINALINDHYFEVSEEDQQKINQLIEVWLSEGLFSKQQLSIKGKDETNNEDAEEPVVEQKEEETNEEAVTVKKNVETKTSILDEPLPKHVYVNVQSDARIPYINDSLSNTNNVEEQKDALKELLHFLNDNMIDLNVTKNTFEEGYNTNEKYSERRHIHNNINSNNNNINQRYNNNNNQLYNNNNNYNNNNQIKNTSRDTMSLFPGEKNIPGSNHYRNKPVLQDPTCPMNNIRVMSRTLFIGGINNRDTKRDLLNRLKPYGEIQTCFLSNKKGHGFVKAYSRAEAENIIKTFNILASQDHHELRVRWALGFGPRAYFNFDTGISTVPLYVVTDEEKEWAKNCEWGGTNGKEMVSGMLFEEPDYNPNDTNKINNKRLDFQDHANISNKPLSQRKATELARTNPEILNQRYAQQQQFLFGNQLPPQQPSQPQQFPGLISQPLQQQQMYGNVNNSNGMYYPAQPQHQNNMYNNNMQQPYIYGNNQMPMYNNNMQPPQQQHPQQQHSNNQQQMYNNNNMHQHQQQPSANQLNSLMNLLNQQQK